MKLLLTILLALMTIVNISCGKKHKKKSSDLDAAWASFENKEYDIAYTMFSGLLSEEGSEAVVGQGWCALRQDQITLAETHFSSIAGDSLPDAYSGWIAVAWQKEEYSHVVSRAQFVLRKAPQYSFVHDNTITGKDMQLHEAFGHFYLGNYSACNGVIAQLSPGWTASNDPNVLLAKLETLYEDLN